MPIISAINYPQSPERPADSVAVRQPIVGDLILAMFACGVILLWFLLSTPVSRHWFVVPVYLCGVLVCLDTVRMFRRKVDLFTPIGFLSVVGFHFFFLAPLLHVRTGYWMQYVSTSGIDWRFWMGRMAFINFVSLIFYVVTRQMVLARSGSRKTSKQAPSRRWVLNQSRFSLLGSAFLLLSGVLQVYVFASFGGIQGYISAYEARNEVDSFDGLGIIVMFSEAFPIVAMLLFVVWAGRKPSRQTWPMLLSALVIFVLVQFLFGGLRGSRSNTIWSLFWAVGMIRYWIRDIPRQLLVTGALVVLVFMYAYGFYKALGTEAIEVWEGNANLHSVEERSGRSIESLLLLDLGRSDVQAFLLHQLSMSENDDRRFELALGSTYIASAALLVPAQVWSDSPPSKVAVGTDAIYGRGTYEDSSRRSSRAFGLAGEAMLNFGVIAVPVMFAVFGVLVGASQLWIQRLSQRDSRLLLAPFLVMVTVYLLVWDSDNLVFYLFKSGLVPTMLVVLCSRKIGLGPVFGYSRMSNHGAHASKEVAVG